MKKIVSMMIVVFMIACSNCNRAGAQKDGVVSRIAELPEGARHVIDFEDAAIFTSENDSPFKTSGKHVTQGKKSLRVHYTNKPQWSNIITDKMFTKDWSGFKYLNFDLFLEGELPCTFGTWIRDTALHKAANSAPIGPGHNIVSIDLDQLKRNADLDTAKIKIMCLYKECKHEIVVYLDNMYLSKTKPVPPKEDPIQMSSRNLIPDGGFEKLGKPDKLGSPFTEWISRRWQGASFMGRGKNAVFEGKSSLMLDGRGPCKIGLYTKPVKVSSPTKLKLTVYVQAKNLQKGLYRAHGAITVADLSESGLPAARIKIPAGTYAWKKMELVFDVPQKTPFIKVFVQLFGAGLVWVDSMSLTGVDLDESTGVKISDTGMKLKTDPPIVTESPELIAKKKEALKNMEALRTVIAEAKTKRLDTLYDEIPLLLGKLAFEVRWDIPEHFELRDGYAEFMLGSCKKSVKHLRDVMAGKASDLKVPPHPDLSKLKRKGRYFYEGNEPKILFSMQYHSKGELIKWFCPEGWAGRISAVGGSRYDYSRMPVWEVYQKYPDTRRVYDDGWCGHIIRDKHSAGGGGRCVISLDSPRMKEAIAKSIAIYAARIKPEKRPLFVNMGFEYSYVNYDKYSAEKFRKWLREKHGTIDKLNKIWKTSIKNFDAITPPSYDYAKPEKNPAKYYDWGDFNLWRFTDHMKWASDEIHKHHPGMSTTTGGGHPFGSTFWKQGLDEEALSDAGVTDVFLSETGSRAIGVTSVMDMQRSIDPEKPILDPEYHARPNTCFLMFLHGCGVMDYWWWPKNAGEFYSSSMKHSHLLTLPEVEAVLKTGLNVRRLAKYIIPFPADPAKIALLYSRATLIQKHPGGVGHKTPYSFEIENSYGAAVRLDTQVGFATSKRVRKGELSRYRMLVIPGCRYMIEGVYEKIKDFVKKGGTVVITPTSLVADEYNRRRNYLSDIGIEILSEELPEFMAGKAKRGIDQEPGELDFIQGPIAKTRISKEPRQRLKLKPGGLFSGKNIEMEAAGVIQTVKASNEWQVIAVYKKGEKVPAILKRSMDKGRIYYMACQLTLDDRKAFFDALITECGISRPIRAYTDKKGYLTDVESRTVAFEGKYLTYLHNLGKEKTAVKLVPEKGKKIAKIFDVISQTDVTSDVLSVAPYETRIMQINLK